MAYLWNRPPSGYNVSGRRRDALSRYICTNCGYVYDPAAGDPLGGIPPGTPFEELPDAWICPVCYVPKSFFDELE